MTEDIKGDKESAVLSVGWLFGGNYTKEQAVSFEEIIKSFESLAYLERQHILEVLVYIYKNAVDDEEVVNTLYKEYEKQQ